MNKNQMGQQIAYLDSALKECETENDALYQDLELAKTMMAPDMRAIFERECCIKIENPPPLPSIETATGAVLDQVAKIGVRPWGMTDQQLRDAVHRRLKP